MCGSAPTCLCLREKEKSTNMSDYNEKIKYPSQSPNSLCISIFPLTLLTFMFSLSHPWF